VLSKVSPVKFKNLKRPLFDPSNCKIKASFMFALKLIKLFSRKHFFFVMETTKKERKRGPL
jgi:hypothetical protein